MAHKFTAEDRKRAAKARQRRIKRFRKIVKERRKPGEIPVPLVAIRNHCLECVGYSENEVKYCTSRQCWLFPLRFGKEYEYMCERDVDVDRVLDPDYGYLNENDGKDILDRDLSKSEDWTQVCSKCGEPKLISFFPLTRTGEYDSECRLCKRK